MAQRVLQGRDDGEDVGSRYVLRDRYPSNINDGPWRFGFGGEESDKGRRATLEDAETR